MSAKDLINVACEAGCIVVHDDNLHIVVANIEFKTVVTVPNVKVLAQELIERIKEILHLN